MGINVLSLFDGISCGQVALERAGIKVDSYFASEIDENAIKITMANYPNTIQLGDVQSINIKKIKELPPINLVLAGSPCQGFSRQGKGLNFEDPRSRLFFNFVEIVSLIKLHNNPNVKFLLENVNMKKEWENVITDYVGVNPIKINSKLLSAQNRPRTYWTDINDITIPKDKKIVLKDILDQVEIKTIEHQGIKVCSSFSEQSRNLINVVDGEIRISQTTNIGYKVAFDGDGINISFPTSKSRRGRVIDQKSSTIDTACNIGVLINNTIRRFTIEELEKLQTLTPGYTDHVSMVARKKAIGNSWTVNIIAHILKSYNQL
jgi:DNA (cytosine-5)-methyltransferase 3A